MRTGVKNPQQAQGAPVADVQPTKQATSTPPTPEYNWKRYWFPRDLYRAKFSDVPEIYMVHIDGSVPYGNLELTRNDISAEIVNAEIHPALAIGRAVIEFMSKHPRAHIHDITAYKRVAKQPKRPKIDKKKNTDN